MPISPLTTISGIALGSLATGAVSKVADATSSFVDVLRRNEPATEAADTIDPRLANELLEIQAGAIEEFTRQLRDELFQAGIDDSIPVTLRQGVDGKLRVSGFHPQQQQIESLLADSEELQQLFSNVAASRDVFEAGASGFQLIINARNGDVYFP